MSGDNSYDCGLDEACLDEVGHVKAGTHPQHDADTTPICHRCGLTCERPCKTQVIITPMTTYYFHDAHAEDCYEQTKAERMAKFISAAASREDK